MRARMRAVIGTVLLLAGAALASPIRAAGPQDAGDYRIGPDDVLQVLFWKEKDLSAEVVVRPDGRISLPLLNDVVAAGLTPEQLREAIVRAAERFVERPNATVIVRQINSRKVYITGLVDKPGSYALTEAMTVLQLIAMAGGLKPEASGDRILVMHRDAAGAPQSFNYNDVAKGRRVTQNVGLRPGDTVVVP